MPPTWIKFDSHALRAVASLAVACSTALHAADIDATIDNGLAYSAIRAEVLASSILVTRSVYTDYSNTSGAWIKRTRSTWTSGFVPGIFWQLHDITGDAKWLAYAQNWTEGVRARATESDNDTGFQIFCSFGRGYVLTGETNADYFDVLQTASNTFDTQRFNSTIGCYRSWRNTSSDPVGSPSITDSTSNPNDAIFEVNIDEMMNLELPLFVGLNGGDPELVNHVVAHADRTWADLVRPDGSTYHVVGFNTDGTVRYHRTHQGWITDSTWSRGQAWAVYGYTMVYRYTTLPRMLERAEACFDAFIAATAAQSTDSVPYSDFNAPVDAQNPKDSSAAAIVASAAVDLYRMTGAQKYRDAAESILLTLGGSGYISQGTSYQPVLRRGSQKWGDSEVGTIFGDYYFLEAMIRHRDVIGTTPTDPGSGRLVNISTRGLVGTGDHVLIGGFVIENAPRRVLIRGVGPTLTQFGVGNELANPTLTVFSDGTPVAENDNWSDSTNAEDIAAAAVDVGAFALPTGSADAAALLTLEPGGYTVHVSGVGGTTGVALFEAYAVP